MSKIINGAAEAEVAFRDLVAVRLKQARDAAGLSLRALSDRLDGRVSHTALNKYESAKMVPDTAGLVAIADALSCPVDHFFRPLRPALGQIKFRKNSRNF